MVFERSRPSRLAAVIILGTFIGGGLGFYIRENWDLKGKETRATELEKKVDETKARIAELHTKNKMAKNSRTA